MTSLRRIIFKTYLLQGCEAILLDCLIRAYSSRLSEIERLDI